MEEKRERGCSRIVALTPPFLTPPPLLNPPLERRTWFNGVSHGPVFQRESRRGGRRVYSAHLGDTVDCAGASLWDRGRARERGGCREGKRRDNRPLARIIRGSTSRKRCRGSSCTPAITLVTFHFPSLLSPFFVFLSFSDFPPPIPHVQGTIDLKGLADQGLLNRQADGHRITCPGIPKSVSLSTPFCIFQDTSTF